MSEFNRLDAGGTLHARPTRRSSDHSAELVGEYAPATNAIDGDPSTFWHTLWQNASPLPPHTFTVNLGAGRAVVCFQVIERPGRATGTSAAWRFYTSVEGINWTLAAQ